MRVGISLRSGYVIRDVRRGAQWMVERARAARAAELDALFVGVSLTDRVSRCATSLPIVRLAEC